MSALKLVLLTAVLSAFAWSEGNQFEITSLKGINELAVLVEDLPQELHLAGLDERSIQTDVELKLRLAGIKVVTTDAINKTPGGQHLYVGVIGKMSSAQGLYAISYRLELCQSVRLYRDPSIAVPGASTWSVGSVAISGKEHLSKVRDSIKEAVDYFINDYLAANPRQ